MYVLTASCARIDIPQDAVNASALSSTDLAKGQADDALISMVKALLAPEETNNKGGFIRASRRKNVSERQEQALH